jgi:hypothetical protein
MIGLPALIPDAAFIIISGLVGFLSLRYCWKTRRWGAAVLGLFCVIVFAASIRTLGALIVVRGRLHSLSASDVQWIDVDGKRITQRDSVDAVVSSLSHVDWFEGRNIGARWMLLRIGLADGREYRYDVAPRVHNEGGLVSFGEHSATGEGPAPETY